MQVPHAEKEGGERAKERERERENEVNVSSVT